MYKDKKFINKFRINYEEPAIWKCPSKRKAVKTEYNTEKEMISALFYKTNCNKCRYVDMCIKKDYDETFNKVEISCLDLNKQIVDIIDYTNIEEDSINNAYTMLGYNNSKSIEAIPIEDNYFEIEEKYEEILIKGVEFKREGKYEEAKFKYIEAIKKDAKKPTAYYNLGKILYILGEFEASARSYKTSFELGVDPVNVLIHLGHALLDKKSKDNNFKVVVSFYERGINPYLIKKYIDNIEEYLKMVKQQPSKNLLEEYENKCIMAAKGYLGIE